MREGAVTTVALVGLGSIGRRHLKLLKELRPAIRVVLVRSGLGAQWPEAALADISVPDIEAAINIGVQAAIISSPSPFHVKQAIAFLGSNIPLLIEKPLSDSMEEIESLRILAQSRTVPILIGYVLRYSACARQFQKLLQRKCVGNIVSVNIVCRSYLPDWRPGQDYRKVSSARAELGGGALLELSHEIDYANWLFGPFVNSESVLSNSGCLDINVEDRAEINLYSPKGYAVSAYLDFCSKDLVRETSVTGLLGKLTWNAISHSVKFTPEIGEELEWVMPEERDKLYKTQLKHFLDCIEHGDKPEVTLKDGIETMKLIDSIRRSSQLRAIVAV